MRIAFYAPLKSPNHPVPSGDREMARLLIAALKNSGNKVELASELRSFAATLDDNIRWEIAHNAVEEMGRLVARWRKSARPDLWFTYHPYYKAPDLIGPQVARALDIPYVTAEASYSKRRDESGWLPLQARVADAVRLAAVNICFTERDQKGLLAAVPDARLARLAPFIDTAAFDTPVPRANPSRLVTIAMMRPGDKLESYKVLADALAQIIGQGWTLTVIGDGPVRQEVRALFARFGDKRIEWLGELPPEAVRNVLRASSIYVWPGIGEAYGIAYMEAQAAGLPVIAQKVAGVPEVVQDGTTGVLTMADDIKAYASAISGMLSDGTACAEMGMAAHRFIVQERSLATASDQLDRILRQCIKKGG